MVISYFPVCRKYKKAPKNDILSDFVRAERIRDRMLVTSDNGSWALLSSEQYNELISGNIKNNAKLLEELERIGVVWTNRNICDITKDYRERKSFLFQGTSLHIVIPTLRCNHSCLYCHSNATSQKSKSFDMDNDTAKKVVDFIFQSPSKNIKIEFQGGEPLINFETVKFIIEYAKKVNIKYKKNLGFDLVTNLSIMDDDKAEYLLKNKVGICTSLDGPEHLHNKNRRLVYGNSSNSYEKVVYWIKELKKRSGYDILNTLMVVTRHSLPYWKEIVDEYANLGLKNIWIKYANPLGKAINNWGEIGYKPEEYLKFWRNSIDYIVQNGIDIKEMNTAIILKKMLTKEDAMYLDLQSPCGAAIGQLAYDQKGNIYTCDEGRMYEEFRLGNVKKDNYSDTLTSPKTCVIIASSTNDTTMCDICAWKPYCGLCPVCTFASQGNIINKLPEDYRCKILKGQFSYIFEKLLYDSKYRKVFMKWAQTKLF